jgi:deoxyribonuclease V
MTARAEWQPGRGAYREFPADPAAARRVQQEVREHVVTGRATGSIEVRTVAGADAAYSAEQVFAAFVVMTFPALETTARVCAVRPITFPYIPGLLAFREGPALVAAFYQLPVRPDLLLLNGHGYAHPDRAGLASHIGVVLDLPTIGVARHLLTGTATEPAGKRGSVAPVTGAGEVIGMAVRTQEGRRPVYVSAGHRVDLAQSVELVMQATTVHRLPEPLRCADLLSRKCRQEHATGSGKVREILIKNSDAQAQFPEISGPFEQAP